MEFPVQRDELREFVIKEKDQCPECGGELDTGYECNKCGFDALPELNKIPKLDPEIQKWGSDPKRGT